MQKENRLPSAKNLIPSGKQRMPSAKQRIPSASIKSRQGLPPIANSSKYAPSESNYDDFGDGFGGDDMFKKYVSKIQKPVEKPKEDYFFEKYMKNE